MALKISKSMDISDFWRNWELIQQMVAEEYGAVQGMQGFYDLELSITWDVEKVTHEVG